MFSRRQIILGLLFFMLSHCATIPVENRETILTDATELPSPSRQRLWNSVLEQLPLRTNVRPKIRLYFENIMSRLYAPTQDVSSFKIYFSNSKSVSLDNACWVFPGIGVIINLYFIKSLGGENEYAAALAFAYERSRIDTFKDRLVDEINPVPGNASRIINFLTEENMAAIQKTADVLYTAGYDPRSILRMFESFVETPEEKMKLLKEVTQQTINKYPPIVNPVTKTTQFYKIQQEINKL